MFPQLARVVSYRQRQWPDLATRAGGPNTLLHARGTGQLEARARDFSFVISTRKMSPVAGNTTNRRLFFRRPRSCYWRLLKTRQSKVTLVYTTQCAHARTPDTAACVIAPVRTRECVHAIWSCSHDVRACWQRIRRTKPRASTSGYRGAPFWRGARCAVSDSTASIADAFPRKGTPQQPR